jgi:hypothetical protein
MAATKPTLSREYLYVPMTNMNLGDVATLALARLAFKLEGVEPTDPDWINAIKVNAVHALYVTAIGPSLVTLLGPLRGDTISGTTTVLADGDWQVWVEAKAASSDERVVRVAGIFTQAMEG